MTRPRIVHVFAAAVGFTAMALCRVASAVAASPIAPSIGDGFPAVSALNPVAAHGSAEADHWTAFGLIGADGTVRGAISYRGGNLLWGSFQHVQGVRCDGLAWWDGTRWSGLGDDFAGDVTQVLLEGDSVRVFGDLNVLGSNVRHAVWNGEVWIPVGHFRDRSMARVVRHDGRLVGLLRRDEISGGDVDSLMQWTESGWIRYGDVFPFQIKGLEVVGDRLHVVGVLNQSTHGGWFEQVMRDGDEGWEVLGEAIRGYVDEMAQFEGSLLIGGYFPDDGSPILRWTDAMWEPFSDFTRWGLAEGRGLEVWQGKLYWAGYLQSLGSGTTHLLGLDGSTWVELGTFTQGNAGGVQSLQSCNDALICIGQFTGVEEQDAHYFAAWNGSEWTVPGEWIGGGFTREISSLFSWRGDLIAAGSFISNGSEPTRHLARWDGARWHALGGELEDAPDLVGEFQGDLIVAGVSVRAGDAEVGPIVRWNGTEWDRLGTELPVKSRVTDMVEFDGRLFVAGHFRPAFSSDVVVWDGRNWSSLGISPDGGVSALEVYNGSLYAAGAFRSFGGVPKPSLVRWNRVIWRVEETPWDNRAGVSGISGLCVYDGQLVATGYAYFASAAVPASNIRAFDGETWHELAPARWDSHRIHVHNGELFAIIPEVFRSSFEIARLVEGEWETIGTSDGDVSALETHDGGLWIGGSFKTLGGKVSSNIARWDEIVIPRALDEDGLIRSVYPQPATGAVTILYESPRSETIETRIFDAMGREVRSLGVREEAAGRHTKDWDGRDDAGRQVPSGLYYLRLDGRSWSRSTRIVVIR